MAGSLQGLGQSASWCPKTPHGDWGVGNWGRQESAFSCSSLVPVMPPVVQLASWYVSPLPKWGPEIPQEVSLVIQWLRLQTSNAGGGTWIPGWELKSHMPHDYACILLRHVRLCNPMDCSPPGSSVRGDSPDKNTGVSCQALLQGIFPTQGSNSGLWSCRQILYHLSHQRSQCCMAWRKNETKEGRKILWKASSDRAVRRKRSLTCDSPKLCASHVTLASPSNLAELLVPYLRIIGESAPLP